MFDDIRAPRGPEFRPLGPRAACAARPAEQFIFLLLPTLGSDLLTRTSKYGVKIQRQK